MDDQQCHTVTFSLDHDIVFMSFMPEKLPGTHAAYRTSIWLLSFDLLKRSLFSWKPQTEHDTCHGNIGC